MTTRQRRDRQRAIRARKPWAERHWPDLWEIALLGRALTEQWPLSPADRQAVLERLRRIVDSSPSESRAVAAARAIIAADTVNAHRQATQSQALTAANTQALATLRALLSSPQAATLLGSLPITSPPPD